MKPFADCPASVLSQVQVVLCDLDDTLTTDGKLPSVSYAALEAIRESGRKTIVVTGRPAGWCDLMARFWPVDGVVGENGAFYFRYDSARRKMRRRFLRSASERERDRAQLMEWFKLLKVQHPSIELASDQDFRISDIAIDVCEDVPPLSDPEVQALMAQLRQFGATVKLSSIHVNAWIGRFDKLSMARMYLSDELALADAAQTERVLYIGDSPNDEPMFRHFAVTVGVQNVVRFLASLEHRPVYVTDAAGGAGFAEMVKLLTATSLA